MFPQHLSDESWLRISVLLTFQKALLGEIVPALRAVTVRWDQLNVEGIMYYDGQVSERERERVEEIETEIMAAFPDHHVQLRGVGLGPGEKLVPLFEWVFVRAEKDAP